MWLINGDLDTNQEIIYYYLQDRCASFIKRNAFRREAIVNFYRLLLEDEIYSPLTGVFTHTTNFFTISPGNNRLARHYFKSETAKAMLLCDTESPYILKNAKTIDNGDNLKIQFSSKNRISLQPQSYVTDFEKQRLWYRDWQSKIATKYGRIVWRYENKMAFQIPDSKRRNVTTTILLKEPLGIYESICYLSGINYRKIDAFEMEK